MTWSEDGTRLYAGSFPTIYAFAVPEPGTTDPVAPNSSTEAPRCPFPPPVDASRRGLASVLGTSIATPRMQRVANNPNRLSMAACLLGFPRRPVARRVVRVVAGEPGEAVLLCGVYGTGKSSVAAEIAEILERRGVAYGALDLDWLMWFDVPGLGLAQAGRVSLANIAAVVGNYREAGVRHFVMAGAVTDRREVETLQTAAGVPIRVVRLHVPYEEIARRLQRDPTGGRRDDLRVARQWLKDGVGDGVEDVNVRNTGRVDVTAGEILAWLGWVP